MGWLQDKHEFFKWLVNTQNNTSLSMDDIRNLDWESIVSYSDEMDETARKVKEFYFYQNRGFMLLGGKQNGKTRLIKTKIINACSPMQRWYYLDTNYIMKNILNFEESWREYAKYCMYDGIVLDNFGDKFFTYSIRKQERLLQFIRRYLVEEDTKIIFGSSLSVDLFTKQYPELFEILSERCSIIEHKAEPYSDHLKEEQECDKKVKPKKVVSMVNKD